MSLGAECLSVSTKSEPGSGSPVQPLHFPGGETEAGDSKQPASVLGRTDQIGHTCLNQFRTSLFGRWLLVCQKRVSCPNLHPQEQTLESTSCVGSADGLVAVAWFGAEPDCSLNPLIWTLTAHPDKPEAGRTAGVNTSPFSERETEAQKAKCPARAGVAQ